MHTYIKCISDQRKNSILYAAILINKMASCLFSRTPYNVYSNTHPKITGKQIRQSNRVFVIKLKLNKYLQVINSSQKLVWVFHNLFEAAQKFRCMCSICNTMITRNIYLQSRKKTIYLCKLIKKFKNMLRKHSTEFYCRLILAQAF